MLSRSHLRHSLIALGMLPVFTLIHLAAYWIRFDGVISPEQYTTFVSTLVWILVVKTSVFGFFRVYHGWRRFVTFHDLTTILKAAGVSSVVWALVDYLLLTDVTVPRTVFLVDCGLTIVSVGGLRALSRLIQERSGLRRVGHAQTPVFIVGANDSGEALLRAIRRGQHLPYCVVGFVAEDPYLVGSTIGGVPVIGVLDDTCSLAVSQEVTTVLITTGELTGRQVRKLVEDGRRTGVDVKVLPSYEQLLDGRVDLRPRTVSIEDLLRREPVELNLRELHHWLENRVLMVTGSAGSIGSEICRQLLTFSPRKLILVDQSETGQFYLERDLLPRSRDTDVAVCIADVCDEGRMRHLFETHRPEIVFHAAAYKHVPLMEVNSTEAVKNIVRASRLMADLSHRYEVASFVMISTDKAVNPTSVMGACKRVAELYVQAFADRSACRFVTVRFGNVLDSAGSVVPVFRDQIAAGGPVTVTHPDMTRFFMTIPEASQLVIQAGAMGQGGEIFVLDMGEPVRIVDLARDMIHLSGLREGDDIEIEFTGIRPGEKLYEELHVDGERHLPTSHPKILITQGSQRRIDQVSAAVARLTDAIEHGDDAIRAELKRIVPQFESPHLPAAPVLRRMAA
ncbi:MAG: polysaccharide biosynthesis protein [Pirellulaceae bacterium]